MFCLTNVRSFFLNSIKFLAAARLSGILQWNLQAWYKKLSLEIDNDEMMEEISARVTDGEAGWGVVRFSEAG